MNTGPLWSSCLTQVFWLLHFLCFESERREQGVDVNQLQPSVLENDTNMECHLSVFSGSFQMRVSAIENHVDEANFTALKSMFAPRVMW